MAVNDNLGHLSLPKFAPSLIFFWWHCWCFFFGGEARQNILFSTGGLIVHDRFLTYKLILFLISSSVSSMFSLLFFSAASVSCTSGQARHPPFLQLTYRNGFPLLFVPPNPTGSCLAHHHPFSLPIAGTGPLRSSTSSLQSAIFRYNCASFGFPDAFALLLEGIPSFCLLYSFGPFPTFQWSPQLFTTAGFHNSHKFVPAYSVFHLLADFFWFESFLPFFALPS